MQKILFFNTSAIIYVCLNYIQVDVIYYFTCGIMRDIYKQITALLVYKAHLPEERYAAKIILMNLSMYCGEVGEIFVGTVVSESL